MRDIKNMTSNEVKALIFENKGVAELTPMPTWVAEQVIECDHFDTHLKDWAWSTIDADLTY